MRVYASIREAVHAVASTGRLSMKQLAPELDWSPSELSMRTTLGGDRMRMFPLDDGRLVKMMKAQDDYSPLATLANDCGFELRAKERDVTKMVADAKASVSEAVKKFQQLILELDAPKGKGR